MNNPEILSQFVKFALIGCLNTAVHYGVFLALFRAVGAHYLVASGIGYCAGIANSYVFNRRWTFRSDDPRKAAEFTKFALVNVASILVNLGVLRYCVGRLGMRPEIGQVVAIFFSMATNFGGNKYWTFRRMREGCCVDR